VFSWDDRKGKKSTPEERAQLSRRWKQQYEEGWSIRAIAKESGRSYGMVHMVLNEADVKMRSRGGKEGAREQK
jgi:DNA-directed RNA polymerase specialized sigma24 family protein